MLQLFEQTSERYTNFCSENKYQLSDFIRKTFQSEIKRIESNLQLEDFIYFKLCGDNQILTKIRLTDDDVKGLCAVLEEDESIKSLDLRYNRITDVGAEYLSNLLRTNRTIVELNLMGNDIGELGAKHLGNALMVNSALKIVKLTGNKIGDPGAMNLAQALQFNTTLEELDLGECDLQISSVISFATILSCNTTLKAINLDRPLLWTQQEEPTVHIENMLYVNTSLKELHLSKHQIRDFGMERLCDALVLNRSLTILDLSCNRITRDGARVLAKVLQLNIPLRVLDLGFNRIHDQGVTAIAHSLGFSNTNLKCLVITHNEIHDEGLIAISKALEQNSTLETIYIRGNHFTSEAIKVLQKHFDNYRLLETQTDVRPYQVDGVSQLAVLPHSVDYRRYRFVAPIHGADVPVNRSYAIM